MKSLKPSHRERKRYLLITGKNITKNLIDELIFNFIGILGYAKACPQMIKISRNDAILAINRNFLNEVQMSLFLSDKGLKIIKVSGSLKKLKA